MSAVEVRLGQPCLGIPDAEPKQTLRDSLLSQFIHGTGAETSLAHDLLTGSSWDLEAALETFQSLYGKTEAEDGSEHGEPGAVLTLHHHDPAPKAEPEEDPVTNSSASSSTNGKLSRGFSKATENSRVMWNARAQVVRGLSGWTLETPSYTFTLPDLAAFPANFRRFLEKDLIETSTLKALETSGHLNWWTPSPKLWPLATSGDGNCLLHSASLGMWGFHDRLLILRKALFDILGRGSRRHALWRRWRWQQHHANKASGLVYTEEEWRHEWAALVRLASPTPRSKATSADPIQLPNSPSPVEDDEEEESGDRVWESLEEIHVFALAHVLKRPVIVVADTVLRDSGGEAFAPIPFSGLYLPLECPAAECHRSPLVLSYDAAHFSALVLMQTPAAQPPALIPITTDKARRLLPLHFAADPGPDFTWWADEADERIAGKTALAEDQKLSLIRRYLDIAKVPARRGSYRPEFVVRPVACSSAASSPSRSVSAKETLAVPNGKEASQSPRKSRKLSLTRLANSLKKKMTRKEAVDVADAKPRESSSLGRRFSFRSGKKVGSSERCRSAGRRASDPVSTLDLHDSHVIVGARLNTNSHHQYMTEMVDNYLKAARIRFDGEQKSLAGLGAGGGLAPRNRERISRSFSATSLTCINGPCPHPASPATNFLCGDCFASQRDIMASFSSAAATAAAPPPKSATLPSLRVPVDGTPRGRPDATFGVRSVTADGVTRYFLPPSAPTAFCRSPHCQHYSNGHPTLCRLCLKP